MSVVMLCSLEESAYPGISPFYGGPVKYFFKNLGQPNDCS